MERGLKERLVGAAVLVALAVVFIPMLLDESPNQPGPLTDSNIPERPSGEDGFSSRIVPTDPEPVDVVPPPEPEMPEAESQAVEETEAPAESSAEKTQTEAQAGTGTPADSVAETEPAPSPDTGQTSISEAPAEAESEPESEPAPQQTDSRSASTGETGDVSGWVVQLGSFAQEDNARDLDKKLREAGHPSFVEPVRQSGKTVYRVRVGPEVQRSEAEKVLERITAKFELKGIVVSYP